MAFSFKKLVVYRKAVDFADQICARTENFSRGYDFLVDQLNRAKCRANIACARANRCSYGRVDRCKSL